MLYYPSSAGRAALLENAAEFEVLRLLQAVEPETGRLKGKRVLDYGCGNGRLLSIVAQRGASVCGIEQSATARKQCTSIGLSAVYADLNELAHDPSAFQFDLITMCDVIEHLREPWLELSRLRRFLLPNGKVIITTPNADSLRSQTAGSSWDQRRNWTHFYYFSRRSLTRVLKRAGYTAVAELAAITEYSHHGPLRRKFQRLLARHSLQGGLLFMAGIEEFNPDRGH
jgi:SAM-dependent methyltransferase